MKLDPDAQLEAHARHRETQAMAELMAPDARWALYEGRAQEIAPGLSIQVTRHKGPSFLETFTAMAARCFGL